MSNDGWISVDERLPPDEDYVDFWVERKPRRDGVDISSNERGRYFAAERLWYTDDIHGEIDRYCLLGTEKVTHWRPIAPPPPPADRKRIEP